MAAVHIVRSVAAPAGRVWEALVDFAAHGRVVPLTRMRLGDGPVGPGWRFVAERRDIMDQRLLRAETAARMVFDSIAGSLR